MRRRGQRSLRFLLPGGLVLAASLVLHAADQPARATIDRAPLQIRAPVVALHDLPAKVELRWSADASLLPRAVEIRDRSGNSLVAEQLGAAGLEVELRLPAGVQQLSIQVQGFPPEPLRLRVIRGGWTLVPPLLAILMALALRQVIPALLGGVWIGAWIAFGNPFTGFLRTLDHYLVGELTDRDKISIVAFSLLLGGMVGVISRAGGTAAMVRALSRRATSGRRGQFFTWLMGLLVFFDDYANTLVVGNTMRPVTDRLRISREKLAYIVDSTAAPVASLALISTWIGFEVSLISDALEAVGAPEDAYWIFLKSLPHFFYPILALAFVVMIALSGRDFGPMRHAEYRAAGGRLIADGAVPLADFDNPSLDPVEGRPQRWINAALPVVVVLAVTFISQYATGRAALLAEGEPLAAAGLFTGGFEGFGRVFSSGNSFNALLYGAVCGCLAALALALGQRILGLADGVRALVEGMKTMFLAFVILSLAWAIGKVCVELGTADYVVSLLRDNLDPRLLPTLIFLLAALISFSTGSSWSTMSILVPIAVPSAFGLARAAGMETGGIERVLLGAVAAVLAGSIFGDHCSPISDTTVMSSMACGCDHVDHVRTQLPYALLVGLVAVAVGSIPSGFGVPPWVSIVAGAGLLWSALRWWGRPLPLP